MSFESGTAVSNLVSQGSGLIFVAYPKVFNILGDIALIVGPLFFLTVYVAGLTSILSSFEVLSISIQNKFGFSRKKTTTIMCIVGAILSMIFATSAEDYLVTVTDSFVNNITIVFSVMVECVLFAWVFKAERLVEFLNSKSKSLKLGRWWLILVKYVIPVLLSVIWLGGIYEIVSAGSAKTQYLLLVLTAILLVFSLVFTLLPAKSKEWFKVEERIK